VEETVYDSNPLPFGGDKVNPTTRPPIPKAISLSEDSDNIEVEIL